MSKSGAGHIMHHLREGQRVNLGAMRCTRRGSYEGKGWDHEGVTVYRYVFVAPTGERFVYSGAKLGIAVGDYVDLRATVKRIETQWDSIRLARVIVTRRGIQEKMI